MGLYATVELELWIASSTRNDDVSSLTRDVPCDRVNSYDKVGVRL